MKWQPAGSPFQGPTSGIGAGSDPEPAHRHHPKVSISSSHRVSRRSSTKRWKKIVVSATRAPPICVRTSNASNAISILPRLGVATTAGRVTKGRRWRSSGSSPAATLVLLSVTRGHGVDDLRTAAAARSNRSRYIPFHNGSGDRRTPNTSATVSPRALINNLSQLPSLRVSARSAVFRYKGKDADPQRVGQDLQVP